MPKCVENQRELDEYKAIFDQVVAYINLRDKVNIMTIDEVREHIEKNAVIVHKCYVCQLVIDNDTDFEVHINECMDLASNDSIKGQLISLMKTTRKSKGEVYLVAKHYDLHNPSQYGEVVKILSEGIDLDKWKRKRREFAVKKECNICFDDFDVTEMFTLDCPNTHRFCRDCMQSQLEVDLKEKRISSCSAPGCSHQITETEVKQLFGADSKEAADYGEILLKKELAKLHVVGCPTPGCKNFIEVANPQIPMNCTCACGASFCSMCRKQYHYRTSCQDAVVLNADWIKWNLTGRNAYRQLLDVDHKRFDDFEKESKRVAARNEELKARYNELVQDEQWKEQNCHGCPHCGRPIQKLDGCDSMVCGSDYHGGNVQNGCGQRFQWSTSKPYKSQGIAGPTEETLKAAKPIPLSKANHGEWLTCDNCQKSIVGLRFMCINCASFNLCEECEYKVDHKHVFKVLQEPEKEKPIVSPPAPSNSRGGASSLTSLFSKAFSSTKV
jgi:hypothetical protein